MGYGSFIWSFLMSPNVGVTYLGLKLVDCCEIHPLVFSGSQSRYLLCTEQVGPAREGSPCLSACTNKARRGKAATGLIACLTC